MVPYVGPFPRVGSRVLIAWDGSQEAARAISDALPLIATAEVVTVVTVGAHLKNFERDDQSMGRVARHLTCHSITVRADTTVRGSNAVSDILLSRAFDLSVDLIVAGAYHHSPLREALAGDVSREILQGTTVPVLMPH